VVVLGLHMEPAHRVAQFNLNALETISRNELAFEQKLNISDER
jgi:hypothetical protein